MPAAPPLIGSILTLLMARQYEPGERIAGERDLATKFGVSRGRIREALSVLEAFRVVESRNKSGLYMGAGLASVEALPLLAQAGVPLEEALIHQSVELRRIHEVEGVRLAAVRRDDGDLHDLAGIIVQSDEVIAQGNARGHAARLDRMFHTSIVKATHNDVFLRVVNVFYIMTADLRDTYFQDENRFKKSHEEHKLILEAVANSDPDGAAIAVMNHLQGTDIYWSHLLHARAPHDT